MGLWGKVKNYGRNVYGGSSWNTGISPLDWVLNQADSAWKGYTGQTSADIEKQNLQLAKDKFAYDVGLQNRIFAREDSAHQREVMDLKAAGLNPILSAGGSGSGAGTPIQTTAPRRDSSKVGNPLMGAVAMLQMKNDISRTYADVALAKANKQKADMGTAIDRHNLNIARKTGMPTNPGVIGRNFRDVSSIVEQAIDFFKNKIQDKLPSFSAPKIPIKKAPPTSSFKKSKHGSVYRKAGTLPAGGKPSGRQDRFKK